MDESNSTNQLVSITLSRNSNTGIYKPNFLVVLTNDTALGWSANIELPLHDAALICASAIILVLVLQGVLKVFLANCLASS